MKHQVLHKKLNIILAFLMLAMSGQYARADGSTYWSKAKADAYRTANPSGVSGQPEQELHLGGGLLQKTAEVAKGRLGRALALSCVMLLTGKHLVKVKEAMSDPVRNPYKQYLTLPGLGRRGTVEELLRSAFKKDGKRTTRYRLPSSDEVELKNAEKTGATPSMALTELIVNERQSNVRGGAYYNRISGYLFVPGVAGYVTAQLDDVNRIMYSIVNPISGEEVANGELSVDSGDRVDRLAGQDDHNGSGHDDASVDAD